MEQHHGLRRRGCRATLAAATLAAGLLVVPASVAGAVRSTQGDDYSEDFNIWKNIRTCDMENDSRQVHADFGVRKANGTGSTSQKQATDGDGANNSCATANVAGYDGCFVVSRHRTVEEINFQPDLIGNWQVTTWSPKACP